MKELLSNVGAGGAGPAVGAGPAAGGAPAAAAEEKKEEKKEEEKEESDDDMVRPLPPPTLCSTGTEFVRRASDCSTDCIFFLYTIIRLCSPCFYVRCTSHIQIPCCIHAYQIMRKNTCKRCQIG